MVKNCRKYNEYRLTRIMYFPFFISGWFFPRRVKNNTLCDEVLILNKFILKSNIKKTPWRMMPEYS